MRLFLSLSLFALFAVLTIPTLAQPGPEAMKERMEVEKKELFQVLELTAEQQPRVESILDDSNEKRVAMMADARKSGGPGAMREKMGELNAETEARLSEVLTDEQMSSYKKYVEETRSKRPRREGGPDDNRIN